MKKFFIGKFVLFFSFYFLFFQANGNMLFAKARLDKNGNDSSKTLANVKSKEKKNFPKKKIMFKLFFVIGDKIKGTKNIKKSKEKSKKNEVIKKKVIKTSGICLDKSGYFITISVPPVDTRNEIKVVINKKEYKCIFIEYDKRTTISVYKIIAEQKDLETLYKKVNVIKLCKSILVKEEDKIKHSEQIQYKMKERINSPDNKNYKSSNINNYFSFIFNNVDELVEINFEIFDPKFDFNNINSFNLKTKRITSTDLENIIKTIKEDERSNNNISQDVKSLFDDDDDEFESLFESKKEEVNSLGSCSLMDRIRVS